MRVFRSPLCQKALQHRRPLYVPSRWLSSTSSALKSGVDTKDRLVIFDTTLRDGEQSPGATLNIQEKIEIAKLLSRLGVDICEAGFPIASPGDFEAVKQIAKLVGPLTDNRSSSNLDPMTICGLSRATEKDIQRCFDAVKYAPKHRIHTFLATSDIHLEHKLMISRQECVQRAAEAVAFAKSLANDVEFSTEDACRSDPKFLVEVITEVIKAGATTINVPDTVGYTTPEEYKSLMTYLIKNIPNSDLAIFSTHCHDDLGLATANTLAGIEGGARQAEVTINGIGERAGNTSLEELVMALKTRQSEFGVYTPVDATYITRASKMVSSFTGMLVQPNKAIVGANAFAHEAGIHQDGVLKRPDTYEIMDPKSVGLNMSQLVLGKHSGKSAYRARIEELGYSDLTETQIEEFVQRFKKLADEKKIVTDADIEAVVSDELYQPEQTWELKQVHVTGGNQVKATATISLEHIDGHEVTEACIGSGPVDAVYQAIHRIVRVPNRLVQFNIAAVTKGIDAIGEVVTKLESPEEFDMPDQRRKLQRTDSGADTNEVKNPQTGQVSTRTFTGHGADTDILVASAKSYLSALNRMIIHQKIQSKSASRSKKNN